jgi:hypothetical protein
MIVTYGESGSGKTHVVLSQAYAIATGTEWAGNRAQRGPVLYVAAEGVRSLQKRIAAYKIARPNDPPPLFGLVGDALNLTKAQDTNTIITRAKTLKAVCGQPVAMIVIYTLSRALAGGDENSSVDMGAFVLQCDRLRFATGASVHVVHHSGKDKAKGARGHSALRAATDTELEVAAKSVNTKKQRDMDEGGAGVRFAYRPHAIGTDSDGKTVTSVLPIFGAEIEFGLQLTPNAQSVLDALKAALADDGTGKPALPFATRGDLNLDMPERSLTEALAELTDQKLITKVRKGKYNLSSPAKRQSTANALAAPHAPMAAKRTPPTRGARCHAPVQENAFSLVVTQNALSASGAADRARPRP